MSRNDYKEQSLWIPIPGFLVGDHEGTTSELMGEALMDLSTFQKSLLAVI